jgi:hypothetical protein
MGCRQYNIRSYESTAAGSSWKQRKVGVAIGLSIYSTNQTRLWSLFMTMHAIVHDWNTMYVEEGVYTTKSMSELDE